MNMSSDSVILLCAYIYNQCPYTCSSDAPDFESVVFVLTAPRINITTHAHIVIDIKILLPRRSLSWLSAEDTGLVGLCPAYCG